MRGPRVKVYLKGKFVGWVREDWDYVNLLTTRPVLAYEGPDARAIARDIQKRFGLKCKVDHPPIVLQVKWLLYAALAYYFWEMLT